jgi:hypothetical protein
VQAYKWLNLAAAQMSEDWQARMRDQILKSRDLVGATMTSEQIAEAQKLAREWKPKCSSECRDINRLFER